MRWRIAGLMLTLWTMTGCNGKQSLFRKIAADRSGIHFNNLIIENDSINPIDREFLYNGGGVAAGDFNNDGRMDLYFTGSMVENKLYLNRGDFRFEDITDRAGVAGKGRWCGGVSVVDINNDGWLDIYVCASIKKDPAGRTNLLYVNQGLDKNGIPVFKEMAATYGLADGGYSVQAAFFDYDNDGDLDMYLVRTKMAQRDVAQFSSNNMNDDSTDVDRLYRNDWNDSLAHPVFTDVSRQAGIIHHGYGLGISIADINRDGWKDVYVTNDFYGSDHLYINNGHGAFTNKVKDYFRHTSQNAMGNDIADINNDGLADVLSVDMNPPDNYRKKKNMGGENYAIYQNMVMGNYMLQYVRNTLQLNQGPRVNGGDSIGDPVFSDIAFSAGVAETDWSWNPSMADVDNDGYRDILITNGYPRDVTDHDFGAFRRQSAATVSKKELIGQIPQIRIPNYGFKNKDGLHFDDSSVSWGLGQPSFSSGAICVDLDNDGDLDYVISNINDEAFLYENNTLTKGQTSNSANFLDITFHGGPHNRNGLGAFAEIYYGNGQQQVYENSPYRGYLSTVAATAHFGLGAITSIDSAIIEWPGGKRQVLHNLKCNQALSVNIQGAADGQQQPGSPDQQPFSRLAKNTFFTDITSSAGVHYTHREFDFIDFDVERLLPHKLSQYGPGLAAGDVDGNGLDDLFIGGNRDFPGKFLLQQTNGTFIERELPALSGNNKWPPENAGLLLFDADNDGDPDLYCASGSNQYAANTENYQDQLWINNGKGIFTRDTTAIPLNPTSKSCVKAIDFDNDGDLDLFVGGRVLPGSYPLPVSSCIYRNDSRPGHPAFTDVTDSVAPGLNHIGLVCDAIWTDLDNDGWMDLIVVGEWMPVTFFHNDHGKLKNITGLSGLADDIGWWNSIAAGDFDNDGDIDYIVGNLGANSFYRAGKTFPVGVYAKDFDHNGNMDALMTLYLPDEKGVRHEFPASSRDDVVRQLPGLRKRFPTYKDFAGAAIADLFNEDELKDALTYKATTFNSCYLENLGKGKFACHPLPALAQLAPLYGMVVDDYDQDGNLDIALSGNDYGTEVVSGRCDALNGLLLLGDGKGTFRPQTILKSGFYVPGDGKALVKLQGPGNTTLLAASQNRGPLRLFRWNTVRAEQFIHPAPDDRFVNITWKNGKTRREELYYGSSFFSQSTRFIKSDSSMQKIELTNTSGRTRQVRK